MTYEELDIRDFPQKGEALKEEITKAVASTQSVIIRTLPNKLVMTRAQYESLEHDPDLKSFEGTVDRVFVTKHNAMDVVIK